jgi:hypothetical protein
LLLLRGEAKSKTANVHRASRKAIPEIRKPLFQNAMPVLTIHNCGTRLTYALTPVFYFCGMESKIGFEDVYGELERIAAVGETCTVQFRGSNGGVATLQTAIRQVFEEDGDRYLITKEGVSIKMSELVAVNGQPVAHFC